MVHDHLSGDVRGRASPLYDDRLLSWPRVHELTGISRTTAWRLQRAGDFPVPVRISPGRVGWRESELETWQTSRAPRCETESARTPPTPCRSEPPEDAEPLDAAPQGQGETAAMKRPPAKRARRRPVAEGQIAFDF